MGVAEPVGRDATLVRRAHTTVDAGSCRSCNNPRASNDRHLAAKKGIHVTGAEIIGSISISIAVISLITTIVIAFIKRSSKVLAYEAYTEFPLFFADSPVSADVQISANGKPLRSPHVLIVTIKNAGNTAIRGGDFIEPIHIKFVDAEIKTLRVQSNTPGLRPDIVVADSSDAIEIQPLLVNPGDGIVLYALLDGCPHRLHLHARAADVKVRDSTRASGLTQSLLGNPRVRFKKFGVTVELGPRNGRGRVPANNRRAPGRDGAHQ